MSRIAVALPYAVAIRDFIHGGALQALLSDGHHQVVIHTINPNIPELQQAIALGVQVKGMEPYSDTRLESLIKRIYPFFFADSFAYIAQSLENRPIRRTLASICVTLRRLIGTRVLLAQASKALTSLHRRRKLPRSLDSQTDLLIGTRSLINSLDYGLMAEAAAYSVPTVTLAGSWDNFTTKGYFPFPVVQTVVWNEKMKSELTDLFEVPPEKISIAGYPRAQLLRRHVELANPSDYLAEIGLPEYRRFILYSASYSELTRVDNIEIPLEYLNIREVCRQLVPELPTDTCILIRLHPFSKEQDEACFDGLERCHVFVPGRQDRYVERVMNQADERHLSVQISQSICVVSMASTISIDALCLKKPIINIAFDPLPQLSRAQSIKRFYEYNHFRDLVRIARLPIAHEVNDVRKFVTDCVAGRGTASVNQSEFENMYAPKNSDHYAQLVCAAVYKSILA